MLSLGLILITVCACGIIASIVMTWASARSALWNMIVGGLLAVAVLIAAIVIGWLLARAG